MSRFLTFATLMVVLSFFTDVQGQERSEPRNIIFMIGDGMGCGHLSALVMLRPDAAISEFPVGGFMLTQSASNFVTESAEAGTALSTGYRTSRSAVGLLPDGSSVETLLEFSRRHGKSIGVVVTSSVTHATPASFLAHVRSRNLEFEIAEQIAASAADVIAGGGTKWFLPVGKGGKRTDGRDLLAEMAEAGYIVETGSQPPTSDASKLIWLAGDDGLPRATKRQLRLSFMVRKALEVLERNENGYVLMVEGSQIDWAAHDNDFPWLKAEMLDFDDAIGEALSAARKDGNTLVVVTSDHETGGMTVMGGKPDGSDMRAAWVHKEHSGVMVPLFAFGPGAERFGGIHRNDELGRMLFRLIGSKDF